MKYLITLNCIVFVAAVILCFVWFSWKLLVVIMLFKYSDNLEKELRSANIQNSMDIDRKIYNAMKNWK